jgi:hypothetical protein
MPSSGRPTCTDPARLAKYESSSSIQHRDMRCEFTRFCGRGSPRAFAPAPGAEAYEWPLLPPGVPARV